MDALLWLGGVLGGTALVWLVINFLLNKFRHKIIAFIVKYAKAALVIVFKYADKGCDILRDKGNKQASEEVRKMIIEVADELAVSIPKIARKQLNDND